MRKEKLGTMPHKHIRHSTAFTKGVETLNQNTHLLSLEICRRSSAASVTSPFRLRLLEVADTANPMSLLGLTCNVTSTSC